MKDLGLGEGIKVFTSIELERSKNAVILQEDIAQLVAIAKLRLVGSSEVASYLKEAVSKLTLLAFEMKPQVLENFGLQSALVELLDKRLGSAKYKIFIPEQVIEELHPTIRTVTFRLSQQVLNNPYLSVFINFILEANFIVDYLCIKFSFDIGFYSDALQSEIIEELKNSIGPLVYLFNGYRIVSTNLDQVKLTVYIKLI
jgi:hypothetical protein